MLHTGNHATVFSLSKYPLKYKTNMNWSKWTAIISTMLTESLDTKNCFIFTKDFFVTKMTLIPNSKILTFSKTQTHWNLNLLDAPKVLKISTKGPWNNENKVIYIGRFQKGDSLPICIVFTNLFKGYITRKLLLLHCGMKKWFTCLQSKFVST